MNCRGSSWRNRSRFRGTCLYPDPLAHARDNMRELSPTTRDKVLSGNATKLYHL